MNDLSDLSAMLLSYPDELQSAIEDAEKQTADEARTIAILQYSSGQNSLDDLAKAGHPYSRRDPNPAYNAAVINGTRAFLYDWQTPTQTTSTSSDAGRVTTTFVENTDPNTQYLWGTDLMEDRSGMIAEIQAQVQPRRLERLAAVPGIAFRKTFH